MIFHSIEGGGTRRSVGDCIGDVCRQFRHVDVGFKLIVFKAFTSGARAIALNPDYNHTRHDSFGKYIPVTLPQAKSLFKDLYYYISGACSLCSGPPLPSRLCEPSLVFG